MTPIKSDDGLLTSNSSTGDKFVEIYNQICRNSVVQQKEWIETLRKQEIKASHPDDGWVNRKEKYVIFCYPKFNDGVSVGDKICLGWPDRYRIVEILKIDTSGLGSIRYYFTEEVL